MKVILLEDIKNVGKKDQIINASDGHAKNYLFPKKLAVEATATNIKKLEDRQQQDRADQLAQFESAKELGEKIEKVTVNIKAKAGEGNKLFGAVTNKEVALELKKQAQFDIDKKKITLNQDIKAIGQFTADAKLHPKVTATFKIVVSPL